MEGYDNLIDEVYIRDRITLYAETPALVASNICKANGVKDSDRQQDVLRRVNQLVQEKRYHYVSVRQMTMPNRIAAYRAGTVKLDPAFVEAGLVDLLESAGPQHDPLTGEVKSFGDLKTARNLIRDLGQLKTVDAFKTAQDVNMNVTGGVKDMSPEERERLLEEAMKRIEARKG